MDNRDDIQGTCPICTRAFVKRRRWQRFCSADCRNEHHEQHTAAVPGQMVKETLGYANCGHCKLFWTVVNPLAGKSYHCIHCGKANTFLESAADEGKTK